MEHFSEIYLWNTTENTLLIGGTDFRAKRIILEANVAVPLQI